MSTTPLMSLVLPVPSVTLGPEWAETLNTALELVDSHDHSSGKGTKVTPAGFNVNADMEFNSYILKEVKSLRLDNQVLALGGTNDVRCLYTVNGELYFNDSNGNQVRLTNAGAIDISTTGGITGDYSTSTADVSYSDVSKIFRFTQSGGVNAKIDVADIILREAISSANSITIKSPTSLASSFSYTLPSSLPTSTSKFMQITTTGGIESIIDVDNVGIELDSNLIQLKNLGVSTAKINDLAVTTAKVADNNITRAKLESVGQQISSSSGTFGTSSTTVVDVTNLTVTITTTGRPVMLMLIPDGTVPATGEYIAFNGKSYVNMVRGSTTLYNQVVGGSGIEGGIPLTSVICFDTPSAGSHTYKVQAKIQSFSGLEFIQIRYAKLVAYEL